MIAVIGVNGVVSHLVIHRFRECGVLISLGASRIEVIRRVTLDLGRNVLWGATGGVLATAPCVLLLRRYVWSLDLGDWAVVLLVPIMLTCVAIGAAALPVVSVLRQPVTVLLRG